MAKFIEDHWPIMVITVAGIMTLLGGLGSYRQSNRESVALKLANKILTEKVDSGRVELDSMQKENRLLNDKMYRLNTLNYDLTQKNFTLTTQVNDLQQELKRIIEKEIRKNSNSGELKEE